MVQRPSAAAGGNTFYQGTRIQVAGTPPSYYQVASDTPYGALALSIPLPVQAMVVGAGTAIQTSSGLSFEDPIEDPTFVPVQLTCADGTNFEKASDYRARCRSTAQNATVGYVPAVVLACQAAGARYVVAFASNYGLSANAFDNSNLFLNDLGLNALYVGDANYQSAPSLIQSCYAAVEGVRVLGADLWIGGFTSVPITLNVLVTLTASPSNLPVVSIRKDIVQAAIGAFGSTTGGYLFKIQALVGAMKNANAFVQTASLASSWSPNTQYGQGNVVVPTPLNGSTYQCTTQGQSGAVQPSFPGIPGTTVGDGGVTWTCTNYPQVGLFAGGVLQTYGSHPEPERVAEHTPALRARGHGHHGQLHGAHLTHARTSPAPDCRPRSSDSTAGACPCRRPPTSRTSGRPSSWWRSRRRFETPSSRASRR